MQFVGYFNFLSGSGPVIPYVLFLLEFHTYPVQKWYRMTPLQMFFSTTAKAIYFFTHLEIESIYFQEFALNCNKIQKVHVNIFTKYSSYGRKKNFNGRIQWGH